jgi:hypothetical protein
MKSVFIEGESLVADVDTVQELSDIFIPDLDGLVDKSA